MTCISAVTKQNSGQVSNKCAVTLKMNDPDLLSLNHSKLVKTFTVTITLSKNIICPFKSSSRNQLLLQKNINFNKLSSHSAVHS